MWSAVDFHEKEECTTSLNFASMLSMDYYSSGQNKDDTYQVTDGGCNVTTCRHTSKHGGRYYYFCAHCKAECPDGESLCTSSNPNPNPNPNPDPKPNPNPNPNPEQASPCARAARCATTARRA